MTEKTLILLRHAKAEMHFAGEDRERPLNARGRRDAQCIGEYMRQKGIAVQRVLCSNSQRTRQTLEHMQEAYGKKLDTVYSPALYLTSPGKVLRVLAETPDQIDSVMIIGHNPTLHELCVQLVERGEERLLDEIAHRYPTSALAEIRYPAADWSEVGARKGILTRFWLPEKAAVE